MHLAAQLGKPELVSLLLELEARTGSLIPALSSKATVIRIWLLLGFLFFKDYFTLKASLKPGLLFSGLRLRV